MPIVDGSVQKLAVIVSPKGQLIPQDVQDILKTFAMTVLATMVSAGLDAAIKYVSNLNVSNGVVMATIPFILMLFKLIQKKWLSKNVYTQQ